MRSLGKVVLIVPGASASFCAALAGPVLVEAELSPAALGALEWVLDVRSACGAVRPCVVDGSWLLLGEAQCAPACRLPFVEWETRYARTLRALTPDGVVLPKGAPQCPAAVFLVDVDELLGRSSGSRPWTSSLEFATVVRPHCQRPGQLPAAERRWDTALGSSSSTCSSTVATGAPTRSVGPR